MRLTEHERERLLITLAADVAERRRGRGLKLNHPEAVAILTSFVLEGARDGRTVAELMSAGREVLRRADVMAGVPPMLGSGPAEAPLPGRPQPGPPPPPLRRKGRQTRFPPRPPPPAARALSLPP